MIASAIEKLGQKCWRDAAAIAFFAALVLVYFFTPISKGLTLQSDDHVGGMGAGQERVEYNKTHDDQTYWTNALFGGMPTYQIAPSYPSSSLLFTVQNVLGLGMPDVLSYAFLFMLGFYIMLRAFDFRQWMAALGAVLWAFSTYFFIIIWAGHIWKVYALAYMPALIGGVVLCLRGRLLLGAVITALFTALEVFSNHAQMTYYFLPVVAVVMGCVAWDEYRKLKASKPRSLEVSNPQPLEATKPRGIEAPSPRSLAQTILRRCAVAIAAALVGVCINLTNLYHTYEYAKETMRGGSELSQEGNESTGGLSRDYITGWSYGIDETWSLLVPNINGGSSMNVMAENETAMKKATPYLRSVYSQFTQYFGDQPMTNGPVYVGIIVVLLALIGLVLSRGPLRWGLLALTLLSIMLAWGHNFMGLTDFFIDNVPLYNKFRTVSSILVVAEFCIPLLAMLGLKEVITRLSEKPKNKFVLTTVGVVCGVLTLILFLMAVLPDVFVTRFVSQYELSSLNQAVQEGLQPEIAHTIIAELTAMRQAVVSADAWRSLAFMLAGAGLLLLYYYRRIKWKLLLGLLTIACIADLWAVNKRYLNDGRFHEKRNIAQTFRKTAADEQILQDEALDYRVLNFAGNTFNENQTSYYHKSVGGYHAAKLQRYQDLISRYIRPEMEIAASVVKDSLEAELHSYYDVINMLNTRWFIFSPNVAVHNPYTFGNAWFVDAVMPVSGADEELKALDELDLRKAAVLDVKDLEKAGTVTASDKRTIVLASYEPNRLVYNVKGDGGLAVLSEIYYPGWRATLEDGSELPILRANYVLRAVSLPAGQHTLTLSFDPQSIHTTEGIAWFAWIVVAGMIVLIIYKSIKKIKDLNTIKNINN